MQYIKRRRLYGMHIHLRSDEGDEDPFLASPMATTAAVSSAFSLPLTSRLNGVSIMMVTKAASSRSSLAVASGSYCMNRFTKYCSSSGIDDGSNNGDIESTEIPRGGLVKSGLYLVGTPIGNLEDVTLRALRVLKAADVILSEDTRHSGKLLQHYNIKTPLLSYHKFNEFQRERSVIRRLQEGEIVALISDAGTPCISDPGMELAKLCADKNIPVTPIPGPSAVIAALSASGLPTDQFTFVGFLPKHTTSRRERLTVSANEAATQIFFVPPHKLLQFLEEAIELFCATRRCVIAREMTKMHEEFWRGTLGEASDVFSTRQPKGEITALIEGKPPCAAEGPSELQLESQLGDLISKGHSLSMAVKLVADVTSAKRKAVYSLALKKFGKQSEED